MTTRVSRLLSTLKVKVILGLEPELAAMFHVRLHLDAISQGSAQQVWTGNRRLEEE